VHYVRDTPTISPDTVPLLSVLIARSVRLDQIHVQNLEEIGSPGQLDSVYRTIKEHHNHYRPLLSLDLLGNIRPGTVPVLREIVQMNLPFSSISIELLNPNDTLLIQDQNEAEIRSVVNGVSTWLAASSPTLTQLSLYVWKPTESVSFPIPPLAALKDLKIISKASNLGQFQLIAPLIPNQFPVLRKVLLSSYADGLGTFAQCSLPSVEELHIERHTSLMSDPWHVAFPNVTVLHFHVHWLYSPHDEANVGFILRHFPRLTHLTLNLKAGLGGLRSAEHFWDILTGRAPHPNTAEEILFGPIARRVRGIYGGVPADPGPVHSVSSLSNLQCNIF